MNNADLAKRVNELTFSLLLLISSLRDNITVEEDKKVISSVPKEVLDGIERILNHK